MASAVTIRTRHYVNNPLMKRRQFVVDIHHPGRAGVSKAELKEHISKMFKVKEADAVVVFNMKVMFGGGKSQAFCCLYDSLQDAKKLHARYHLVRLGILEKAERKGRKGIKEAKNRQKKIRGIGRRIAKKKAKRAE